MKPNSTAAAMREVLRWVPLDAVRGAVVVYRLGGATLPGERGGPMRFYIPDVQRCGVAGLDTCAHIKALGQVMVARQTGLGVRTRRAPHQASRRRFASSRVRFL
jgi:hypothetical protein